MKKSILTVGELCKQKEEKIRKQLSNTGVDIM